MYLQGIRSDFLVQEAGRVIGPCSLCQEVGHTRRGCPEKSAASAPKRRKIGPRLVVTNDDILFNQFVTKIELPTPHARKRSASESY